MNDPNFVYFVLFVVINFLTTDDESTRKFRSELAQVLFR
jgi:hypothetical protein